MAMEFLFFEDLLVVSSHVFPDLRRVSDDFWWVIRVFFVSNDQFHNIAVAVFLDSNLMKSFVILHSLSEVWFL